MNRFLNRAGVILLMFFWGTTGFASSDDHWRKLQNLRPQLSQHLASEQANSRSEQQFSGHLSQHAGREVWQDSNEYGLRNNNAPNNIQDGVRKQGKLSPEERRTLRRQIDEAGHDIYTQKR